MERQSRELIAFSRLDVTNRLLPLPQQNVRQLAYELGPKNIRVNAISAGPVSTLAARGITGEVLYVDAGYHIVGW